jgi:hypothetical protein
MFVGHFRRAFMRWMIGSNPSSSEIYLSSAAFSFAAHGLVVQDRG